MIWSSLFCSLNVLRKSVTYHSMSYTNPSIIHDYFNITNKINSSISIINFDNITKYNITYQTTNGIDERYNRIESNHDEIYECYKNHELQNLLNFLLSTDVSTVQKIQLILSNQHLLNQSNYVPMNFSSGGLYDDYNFDSF